MYRDKKGQIWTTKSEYADVETGEEISKTKLKEYIKIKYIIIIRDEYRQSSHKNDYKEHIKVKVYSWECRQKNRQLTIW